jgi:molybdopterin-guanine dinucleotide biosynthesis protein A
MGTEVVDRMLSEWDERLRLIDESLLALEAEPTYQMLAPRASPRAPLQGETARVVLPALQALDDVFEYRGKLTEVLERARAVRASMSGLSLWGNDDKEREILALLEGPSIELPPEVTPLARRALLDRGARDVCVVPEQLLSAMAAAYERARDAVVAVKQAWERIEPAFALIERQLEDARSTAAMLGIEATVEGELSAATRELETARVGVAQDPLGASTDAASRLGPRVSTLAKELAGIAALRDRLAAGLARSRATLKRLREVNEAARTAVDAMPREISGAAAPGVPVVEAQLEGLPGWLDKIEQVAREGRFQAAQVGLSKWDAAAQSYLANDEKIAGALAAVLARRDELAGRLRARRAQALALVARGVTLEPTLEEMAREAEKLLARRPTPLAHAAALVDRYEAEMRKR